MLSLSLYPTYQRTCKWEWNVCMLHHSKEWSKNYTKIWAEWISSLHRLLPSFATLSIQHCMQLVAVYSSPLPLFHVSSTSALVPYPCSIKWHHTHTFTHTHTHTSAWQLVDFSSMRVQVHVFQLHDDGPAAEELDEDCDVSSANHWMLPSGEHNSPSKTRPEILLNRVNCVTGLYPRAWYCSCVNDYCI